MKKIYLGIVAAAMLFTGCSTDWLDVENPTGEGLEEYYTTEARLNEALNAAYDPIHWPDWGLGQYNALNIDAEIQGDDFWVGGSGPDDMANWHKIFNYQADDNNTLQSLWTVNYSGVKRCNDMLRYSEWVDMDAKTKACMVAQARLMRVYYYNMLWHYWGNIPFYLENLTASNGYTSKQYTADEVYKELVVELENIIKEGALPLRWDDKNCGRASQAMAYMLFAEMVMYQNDKERYAQALGYMKELISSNDYDLVADYGTIFKEEGEWSKESIWEINYEDANNNRGWGSPLATGGTILPTLIAPNSWPGGDGFNAGQDGWGFMPVRLETYNMFAEGDARRAATCWDVRGVSYTERYQDTHIWLEKYRPYSEHNQDAGFDNNLNYDNNLRVYRYAEVLLNAAELALATGQTAGAEGWLNAVHHRAGLTDNVSLTLENIKEERHLEFVGEGKRYWDLVRWGDAASVLKPDAYGYRTNAWTPSKKYLPIHINELDSDPNLVQNNY